MPPTKLTHSQVLEISSFRISGPAKNAAAKYGITEQHVRRIRKGARQGQVTRKQDPSKQKHFASAPGLQLVPEEENLSLFFSPEEEARLDAQLDLERFEKMPKEKAIRKMEKMITKAARDAANRLAKRAFEKMDT